MATYTIRIKLDNEAFSEGNEGHEVARILKELSHKLTSYCIAYDSKLMDINGNSVGEAVRKGKSDHGYA